MRKATGDLSIMTEQERNWRPTSEIISEALLRPLIMLTTEVIMIAFSGYLCLIYGLVGPLTWGRRLILMRSLTLIFIKLYGFFFAYPIVFQQGHNFSPGETGLTFVSPHKVRFLSFRSQLVDASNSLLVARNLDWYHHRPHHRHPSTRDVLSTKGARR